MCSLYTCLPTPVPDSADAAAAACWYGGRNAVCPTPAAPVVVWTADFDPNDGLVCTVGKLSVWPGASNVIAGSANFTVRPVLCVWYCEFSWTLS